MLKRWFTPEISSEQLLEKYYSTKQQKYLHGLVERYNLMLFHYLLSQSASDIAEDALQIMWMKVIKYQGELAQNTQVKNWLFTIARNTLIDELRKQNRWKTVELNEADIITEDALKYFEHHERIDQFNKAIAHLSFYQREAFILQQEGFSVLDICELTQESFETIKSRLRYARKNLQIMLGEEK